MPNLVAGRYLAEAFRDLGRFTSTGFGPVPLTWTEINAFACQTGVISEPWEARCVRDMSVAFLDGIEVGKNPLGKAPWGG